MTKRVAEDELRFAPGVGPRIAAESRPLQGLEKITLAHVGLYAIATTWAFGGNAAWVQAPLAWWGGLGALITLAGMSDPAARHVGSMRALWWFVPVIAFNAVVLAATLNPSLREMHFERDVVLVNTGGHAGWPSSARPALALQRLALFDAAWIACFNLAFIIRKRRALRALLLVLLANALVLSVFGTVQKLSGAKGLFFDAVRSPQLYFFSTFVYHNHWGAFIVLMIAAGLGLTWHYARRIRSRDLFHSPIFGAGVLILLLAATVPLSTSRSCSVLVALLVGGAVIHWMATWIGVRRRFKEGIALPIAIAGAAAALVAAGVWFIARDSIISRAESTQRQVADMRARGGIGARAVLYADTWRMAKDKPWFGWGMGSYPHVFTSYNTQTSPLDRLPVFYHDAHSDWLQALAEHGFIGTLLLGACAIVPLLSVERRHLASAIPRYLLIGCGLIVLYAWIEFPFGNVAVVLLWWLCFISAVQYGRLTQPEAPLARAAVPPVTTNA